MSCGFPDSDEVPAPAGMAVALPLSPTPFLGSAGSYGGVVGPAQWSSLLKYLTSACNAAKAPKPKQRNAPGLTSHFCPQPCTCVIYIMSESLWRKKTLTMLLGEGNF